MPEDVPKPAAHPASYKSHLVDLFRYPLLVFSILVALVIAKPTLGVQFGTVSEVSTSGIKFHEEAPGQIADLESRLNGALQEIDLLKANASEPTQTAFAKEKMQVFAAQQVVSDRTAEITALGSAPGPSVRRGVIWLGDYTSGKWDRVELASLKTGQALTEAPETLGVGTEYTTLGNMVVRDAVPANDKDYFHARKSLGTLPRGTRVRLSQKPVGIDRDHAVQYWAEVELTTPPAQQ